MNELDEVWSQMLADAQAKARAAGRHDVADYLTLKASNDQIRDRSVRWLFDTLTGFAVDAMERFPLMSIEREDPHNFSLRGANLVGSLLRIRLGVRCVTLEAGWTRTPADGFMRGGALAFARITHFGQKKSNAELWLMRSAEVPQWLTADGDITGEPITPADLLSHFQTFVAM